MDASSDDDFVDLQLLEAFRTRSWTEHYPPAAPELSQFIRELEDATVVEWVNLSSSKPDDPAIRGARSALARSLPQIPADLNTAFAEAILRLHLTFQAAKSTTEPDLNPTQRPDLDDLPDRLTRPETLQWVLRILWADIEFWRVLREGDGTTDSDSAAEAYILQTYHARFGCGSACWNQFIQFPVHRRYVFELIPSLPRRFCALPEETTLSGLDPATLRAVLDAAGKALAAHLGSDPADPLTAFARQHLPPTALKAIQAACDRLREDAAWCLKHPGKVPAPRSSLPRPSAARIRRAQNLERMVVILRDDPDIPDFELAKRALGDPGSTGRTQARDAKLLAHFRDRIAVTHYERRGQRKGEEGK